MLALLPITLLATTALTIPITPRSNDPSDNAILESWDIPRLDMHMLSATTGTPVTWTDATRFNTTIDFDAILPSHHAATEGADSAAKNITVNCQASFKNGTLPAGLVLCAPTGEEDEGLVQREQVLFNMKPYQVAGGGSRRPELSFVLGMFRVEMVREGDSTTRLTGSQPITANDAANEPTSYLTCLEGPPFDGLRCKLKSFLSVQKELVIDAKAVAADDDAPAPSS